MECKNCQAERERRNRLIMADDPRVVQQPFVSAPYMHKNNEPRHHAMLLRAAEHAKQQRRHMLWFAAQDTPENPAQVEKTLTNYQIVWKDFCNSTIRRLQASQA